MLNNKNKSLIIMLSGALVALSMLCGCANAPVEKTESANEPATAQIVDEQVPTSAPKTEKGEDTRVDAGTAQKSDPASIEAVAEIADMRALNTSKDKDIVHVDEDENPYDLVWDFGRKYDKYVQLVDDEGMWDVLFDVDFYEESFPMLAMLYHHDKDLLLEHFQTLGVHEGRQGSEAFNVEAYMENCDSELVEAFGDHYECYYFYWALNQGTEKSVDASGEGHALQLCSKLTTAQALELKKVNEYRAEVGAEPVEYDSELAAWANYRAWVDFTGNWDAHDWIHDDANQYLSDEFFGYTSAPYADENKCTIWARKEGTTPDEWYNRFKNSEGHYAAMVDPAQRYIGCSHMYTGSWTEGQHAYANIYYDVYTSYLDTPQH